MNWWMERDTVFSPVYMGPWAATYDLPAWRTPKSVNRKSLEFGVHSFFLRNTGKYGGMTSVFQINGMGNCSSYYFVGRTFPFQMWLPVAILHEHELQQDMDGTSTWNALGINRSQRHKDHQGWFCFSFFWPQNHWDFPPPKPWVLAMKPWPVRMIQDPHVLVTSIARLPTFSLGEARRSSCRDMRRLDM